MGTDQVGARGEGVKDTLESIVIALILAFVFRAFVVEAFVIPTGSMAPTLYGAHGTIICEDCGKEFAYGLRDLSDQRNVPLVGPNAHAVCPNCNHVNTDLKFNDERQNPETGDRILVLKWPNDWGGRLGPERWDVTVFKDPADGTTNFIKRLVGLPNEVLMIVDGDVYAIPTNELSPGTFKELEEIRHEKYEFQAGTRRGQLRAISREARGELDDKLRIARKTAVAQQSLWTVVYEHDYRPQSPNGRQPQWTAMSGVSSGWDTSGPRLRFTDRGRTGDCLALTGEPIVAFNSYNIYGRSSPPVSDQRVRMVFTPTSAQGTLRLRLEKLGRVFWASLEPGGRVSIVESPEEPTPSSSAMASRELDPLPVGESVEVSFENVDYRLALRVAGREILTSAEDKSNPGYYGPDLTALRTLRHPAAAPPRICGSGGTFELTHVAVDRDVYYYHDSASQALALPWAPRDGWASPDHPMLLRGHEYFMLGDNTSASKDSRLWDAWGPHMAARGEDFQLGTVPRDQLIGKAFFVYWPSPHRIEWFPWLPFGLIPDVGRMRWIR